MYGKGASEIKRHYKRAKNLRRDHSWRYENLRRVDQVTVKTRYLVRGSTGKLLSVSELERERRRFMSAELVILGPNFPFHNDFFSGVTESHGPSDEKLRVPLSVFGEYVSVCVNLNFLSGFWNQVGTITDHQSSFISYDWSPDRLSWFFHHVFTVAMGDISTHVGFMAGFSVEFEK